MVGAVYSVCSLGQESLKLFYSYWQPDTVSRRINVMPHPLVQILRQEEYHIFKERAYRSCPDLRETKRNLKDSYADKGERLLAAIAILAKERFDLLNAEQKQEVMSCVHELCSDGRPVKEFLLSALSINGHLGDESITYDMWDHETVLEVKSQFYRVGGDVLNYGEIGYINGVGRAFEDAQYDAVELSKRICSGKEIRGLYSATYGVVSDVFYTVRGQAGVIMRPVELLLRQWSRFFHRNFEDNYLQICHSQGAVMVHHALNLLPDELRKRICVIAIAPAYFIPPADGCQVLHFVKYSDIVPCYLSVGKERTKEEDPDVIIVPEGGSTHGPYGESYDAAIASFVCRYIEKGALK
ncbi:MAG: DUF687 family protein [Chlamydiales bacterium]|nr:DUF687 family protein [Chlamydiales bacterium]